ncbi:MAG TPA: NAD-binding protein [Planctomycetota bacterium]|nr:NAD-binding protein [Planctomycetota bacterium]HRR79409.1 NAD-binding protein [Planctomycetota bacterium]HRT93498.1 NAD-binding protein [Planctomycetota bacterium]
MTSEADTGRHPDAPAGTRYWARRVLFSGNPRVKWGILAILWLAALLLGHLGYARHFADTGRPTTFWHTLHSTLELFKLSARNISNPLAVNWALEVARFLAPGVMFYTVFQTMVMLFARQSQLLWLRRARGHVVICGLGRKAMLLARDFRERGHLVAVIESDPANEFISQCRGFGAVVVVGDASEPEMLRQARVPMARYLIALTNDDGVNTEIAVRAEGLVRGRQGGALECYAHINDRELCRVLRETQARAERPDAFRLQFFNVYERGAEALLQAHPPFAAAEGQEPQLVVVGLGRLGQSLIVRAAHAWRGHPHAAGARPHITVVDEQAEASVAALKFRYPGLDRTCVLLPRQMGVATPQFQRAEFLADEYGVCRATIVYVCLPEDAESLSAALIAHHRLRDLGRNVPVVVRLHEGHGLSELLGRLRAEGGAFENLHAFRLFDETCRAAFILQRGAGATP